MFIRVDASGVRLLQADDLTRFHVEACGVDESVVATALRDAGVGVVTADHAFIDMDALTDLAGEDATPEWREAVAGMIAWAAGKGWTDDQGRVRAHIERVTG